LSAAGRIFYHGWARINTDEIQKPSGEKIQAFWLPHERWAALQHFLFM
jgi:hypothetical protein